MTVSADMPSAMAKNGMTRRMSARRQRPRSHHTHNNRMTGQHDRGRFTEHGGQAAEQGEGVEAAVVRGVEVEKTQQRQEEEQARLGVLEFGDPGDGFHVDGVEHPEHGGEPRPGHSPTAQQQKNQEPVGGM